MFGLTGAFRAGTASAIAAGVAAAVLLPVALPVIARVGRPAMKSAVKTGLLIYEDSRVRLAEAGEYVEDLVAEARAEIDDEATADEGAAGPD